MIAAPADTPASRSSRLLDIARARSDASHARRPFEGLPIMRQTPPVFAAIVATTLLMVSAVGSAEIAPQNPQELLRVAQTALGNADAVKSIHLKGEALIANEWYGVRPGDPFIRYTFDLKALLPDHYLRTQAPFVPDGRVLPSVGRGFAGETAIGGATVGNVSRVDCARLMLILLLNTRTALPLTLRSSLSNLGELQFDGPHNVYFAVALDPATRLPKALRMPVRRPGPDGFPGTETIREVVMTVGSRRTVADVSVPEHLIVKNVMDSKVLEEYRFKDIELNAPLSRGDFKR